jgi:hypothetical protein
MTDEPIKFTHIGVKKSTHRKVAILAKVLDDTDIYSLVEFWADTEWKNALKAGLVTDAMLTQKTRSAHVIGKPFDSKRKTVTA